MDEVKRKRRREEKRNQRCNDGSYSSSYSYPDDRSRERSRRVATLGREPKRRRRSSRSSRPSSERIRSTNGGKQCRSADSQGRRASRHRMRQLRDNDSESSGSDNYVDYGYQNKRHRDKRRERKRCENRSRSSDSIVSRNRQAAQGIRSGVVSDDDERGRSRSQNKPPLRPKLDSGSNRRFLERREPAVDRTLTTQSTSKPNDDSVGHFNGSKGTIIDNRYKIIREVGVGTFGKVVECLNLKRSDRSSKHHRHCDTTFVALKIVRNVARYHDSALIEAAIVERVNRRGGRGMTHCVMLHDSFSFQGHFCLVFESLGPSLYDFLKKHDYQAFPMACVQDFTIQLLEVLEFLHGECGIVHTDLKIENILLTNDREVTYENQRVPESTRLKLIDFGGACYDSDKKKSSIINTRQYRAPEVILGTGWSMPSDMWSAGCILAELYQGELLFATHNNAEHLALLECIIGPFPRRMVKSAKASGVHRDLANKVFDSDGRHRMSRVLSDEDASFVRKAPSLEYLIRKRDTWFLDLLRKILVIDPNERATAHECLHYLARIRRNDLRCCH